ncbi:hypothetical protein NDU88_002213 [Pleurodeles waltl]|uniref:Uncharacterized protein n=1 Tax=Pleurodeles waltl TaxID=8319 RepID=A0AAV7REZ9_PLEWA|nr:hypothetical protein NDU88_002213 [Pleurodeles waltl]
MRRDYGYSESPHEVKGYTLDETRVDWDKVVNNLDDWDNFVNNLDTDWDKVVNNLDDWDNVLNNLDTRISRRNKDY